MVVFSVRSIHKALSPFVNRYPVKNEGVPRIALRAASSSTKKKRKTVGAATKRAISSTKPAAQQMLNCASMLDRAHRDSLFKELVGSPVSVLQGIGPVHTEYLQSLKLETVQDLAEYPHYKLANAIQTLASAEEEQPCNGGDAGSSLKMNIRCGLDRSVQGYSFQQLLDCSTSSLFGISDRSSQTLKSMGVHTVRDLANFKYCRWAEAMVTASKFEQATNVRAA